MKKRRRGLHGAGWAYLFLSPYFLVYLTFGFFPIAYTLFLSFTNWDGINPASFVGLRNYIRLFTKDPYFFRALFNTGILMAAYIPLMLVVGLSLANALYSDRLPFKKFFQLGNFLPYITVPVAVGIIFSLLFDYRTGLINRVLLATGLLEKGVDWLGGGAFVTRAVMVLMIVWQNAGYFMVIYLAGLSAISGMCMRPPSGRGLGPDTLTRITIPCCGRLPCFW